MRPFLFLLLLVSALQAQESPPLPLKRGFSSLNLGDNSSLTKEKLRKDQQFRYPGEPEIDFSRRPEPLLQVEGSGFIRKANLSFYQDRLYLIELNLNIELISYQTMLAYLQQHYQQPQQVDQRRVVWQNDGVELSLEYPTVVRIVDLNALTDMRKAKGDERQLLQRDREAFLQQF